MGEQLMEMKIRNADYLCTIDDLEEQLKKSTSEYEKSKEYVIKLAQTVQNYQKNSNASVLKDVSFLLSSSVNSC